MKKAGLILALFAFAASACDASSSSTPAPTSDPSVSLSIDSPSDGDELGGNVVDLALTVTGFDIVGADGDTSGATGHFHVFVDRDPVAPGEVIPSGESDVLHSTANPLRVSGLTAGEHTLNVVLGDGTHTRVGDHRASVTVTLTGPSVTATAEVDGDSATITATVDGVAIVAAGEDDGTGAHVHYLLDQDVTAGAAIAADVSGIVHSTDLSTTFEGLAEGRHTVLVVLGDRTHVPLDPPVMASVTFTIEAAASETPTE